MGCWFLFVASFKRFWFVITDLTFFNKVPIKIFWLWIIYWPKSHWLLPLGWLFDTSNMPKDSFQFWHLFDFPTRSSPKPMSWFPSFKSQSEWSFLALLNCSVWNWFILVQAILSDREWKKAVDVDEGLFSSSNFSITTGLNQSKKESIEKLLLFSWFYPTKYSVFVLHWNNDGQKNL